MKKDCCCRSSKKQKSFLWQHR